MDGLTDRPERFGTYDNQSYSGELYIVVHELDSINYGGNTLIMINYRR